MDSSVEPGQETVTSPPQTVVPFRMALPLRISTCRKAAGFKTAMDLAKKVGIAPNTITRYENGNMTPGVLVLAKIADACSVPREFLFDAVPGLAPVTKKEEQALTRWYAATFDDLAWVVDDEPEVERFVLDRAA